MLVLELKNISNLADVSDYGATVRVNEKVLWQGVVKEHPRERGAVVLLRRALNQFERAQKRGEVKDVGNIKAKVSN